MNQQSQASATPTSSTPTWNVTLRWWDQDLEAQEIVHRGIVAETATMALVQVAIPQGPPTPVLDGVEQMEIVIDRIYPASSESDVSAEELVHAA